MAISLSRYVNITSAVGGATPVPTRSLIARMFTGNSLLPPGTFLQFSKASDVGIYFGTTSEEYYRAVFYFGWISKNLISPSALQFARYTPNATAPMIVSIPDQTQSLSAWNAISAGSFGLTIGSTSFSFTGLNFSAAANLAAVATILQTAIAAQFSGTTVTYVNNGFLLVGGTTGAAVISVQPGSTGTDISGINLLGWYPGATYDNNIFNNAIYLANALWIPGAAATTITNTLTNSTALSNNFGSFLFLNNLNFTLNNVEEAATWNAAAAQNNMFLYSVPVIAANVSAWTTGLSGYAGLSLTLSQTSVVQTATIANGANTVSGLMNATSLLEVGMGVSGTDIPTGTVIASIVSDSQITMSQNATGAATESVTFSTVQFPEQCPMMIEAATNYSGINTVQNYMFQNFDPYLTPLVTSDASANSYDALSLNYYGQTQSAGVQFNFYQRGLLQGPNTAPLDQNTYVNEIWLKDAIAVAFMNLLLGLTQLPANATGQALALVTIQGVINQALNNGTISVGKTLSTAQQSFITSISNDPNAWYQVQNSGYWVDAIIQAIPATSPTQYEVAYTLIYSKDDVIRLVTGSDILI